MKAVFCGVIALVSLDASAAFAQSGGALARQLDSIAGAGVREKRAVGIVAAVVRGRDTLLLRAYGQSDVEADVLMAEDAVLAIGSVTKQFTAAAILQLRDQGRLSLDDAITRWLPDFDTHGNPVTLRHLLAHTSGIDELAQMPELRAIRLLRNATVTRDSVYRVISRRPFRFPTGTMQMYSNTGYWLLGLIVERVSGMTYEDYVEQRLFAPLGMTRSMYCNSADDIPRRAVGYGMRNGVSGRIPPIVHTGTYAAGAICSSAGDLIAWLAALHGGRVLTPRSYAEMIAPARLNDGTPLRYGMGLVVAEDGHGTRFIGHGGGGFGFSSDARWYPDERLAVVVLTNSEPDEVTAVAERLAATLRPAPRPAGPFTGDASMLVGTYEGLGQANAMVIAVTHTPQGIAYSVIGSPASSGPPPRPLSWVEGLTFREGGALLTFRRNAGDAPAQELRFDTGGDHFILRRQ
jgi:CubicO group peptidase (beta-lactamase class C family)